MLAADIKLSFSFHRSGLLISPIIICKEPYIPNERLLESCRCNVEMAASGNRSNPQEESVPESALDTPFQSLLRRTDVHSSS